MRRLRNIAMRDYQESVTTRQTRGRTDGWTDRQTHDKVIPMCRYASQATQKCPKYSKAIMISTVRLIHNIQNILCMFVIALNHLHVPKPFCAKHCLAHIERLHLELV